MARAESIEKFDRRLREALASGNWELADRSAERLKILLLEAVMADDADAVAAIESILSDAGEVLELTQRLTMQDDASAAAWRLRADAGTATLATRMRPPKPALDGTLEGADIRKLILKHLRESNRPMTNTALADRLGKDPAFVSRTLKTLAARGMIRQWKVGKNRLNALTEKGRGTMVHPVTSFQVGRELATAPNPLPKQIVTAEIVDLECRYSNNLTGLKETALSSSLPILSPGEQPMTVASGELRKPQEAKPIYA